MTVVHHEGSLPTLACGEEGCTCEEFVIAITPTGGRILCCVEHDHPHSLDEIETPLTGNGGK